MKIHLHFLINIFLFTDSVWFSSANNKRSKFYCLPAGFCSVNEFEPVSRLSENNVLPERSDYSLIAGWWFGIAFPGRVGNWFVAPPRPPDSNQSRTPYDGVDDSPKDLTYQNVFLCVILSSVGLFIAASKGKKKVSRFSNYNLNLFELMSKIRKH